MNAFVVKCMALVFMIMDHLYLFIPGVPLWFSYFGRTVKPIFYFLLVESFFHTRDRKKFNIRLFIAAFVVFLILKVALNKPFNIFISMALGVLILNLIEYIKANRGNIFKIIVAFIGIIITTILSIPTEGAYSGVIMIFMFYFLKDKKILTAVGYILLSLSNFLFLEKDETLFNQLFILDYQWMMIFAVIPMLLYNGKPGLRNKFSKYLFYVIYPLHLVILTLINNIISKGFFK